MKRLCSIIMVLLLCLVMAVPVFAAESQEYIFEIMPPISMLDNYDFLPSADCTGVYEGYLPEGIYRVEIVMPSGEVDSTYFVAVAYNYQSDDGFRLSEFIVDADDINTRFLIYDFLDFNGLTVLLIDFSLEDGSEGSIMLADGCFVRFTSVDASVSLADYISSESFSSLLDQIIALLPVVLAVIVGYIGLRKAIAWLMSVMRSS